MSMSAKPSRLRARTRRVVDWARTDGHAREALGAEIAAREDLQRRVDATQVAIDSLQDEARQLRAGLAAEIAAREALQKRQESAVSDVLEPTAAGLSELTRRVLELQKAIPTMVRQPALARLERAVQRLTDSPASSRTESTTPVGSTDTAAQSAPHAPGGNRLYLAIEDELRGDPQVIKRRQNDYARTIAELLGGTGKVADLGCGRGEFLEAARSAGLEAVGVDMNDDAVQEVRSRGLEAEVGDALGYLQRAADSSLDAVTLFHVIEHIGFDVLVQVLAEAHRVLRPGGIVAMETPNVSNLAVGAHTFWLDPTHLRPVPPLLLELVVRHTGFDVEQLLSLHPYPQADLVDDKLRAELPLVAQMAEMIFSGQDLGIIARRATD